MQATGNTPCSTPMQSDARGISMCLWCRDMRGECLCRCTKSLGVGFFKSTEMSPSFTARLLYEAAPDALFRHPTRAHRAARLASKADDSDPCGVVNLVDPGTGPDWSPQHSVLILDNQAL